MAGGSAAAEQWNDPAGRVSFDAPRGWVVEVRRANPDTIVIAGNADNECFVLAVPNSGTRSASAARVIAGNTAPLSNSAWSALANAATPVFPEGNARVVSQSVDTSGLWPVQRAELSGAARPVTALMVSRPGIEITALCWTYGGPDATATYEAFFRSLSHPNDAEWAAAAQAAQPAPAQ
ncbi:MAG: hypothetical protein DCF16_00720 [Alphaproteobacteria bacterium]|nr:MAG: hypothetical protein DCF16_00720 [Alphaproteobacteria bacterium]